MKILTPIPLFILLALCTTAIAETDKTSAHIETIKQSDNQHYWVHFTSKLDPIVINTMHAWIIHIKDKDKNPILNAEVTVDGGMPEHNHGLPTQPRVTKNLGDGCYLLEGMRFHMGGWWTVRITIVDEGIQDSVTFDLQL